MNNFWRDLPQPFFVLAPMADVTDVSFREFIAIMGKPDVMYTEFVACAGLRSDKGRQALLRNLYYTEKQRPIVAQVFGNDPEDFFWCARFIRELGFDGIDVNMGCPDKKVEKQGAGAALIKDPKRARSIIRSLKKGAGDMPVSVKTRIGYDAIAMENWIGEILKEKPSAIIVHLRTRKEMSMVPAHWEEMPKIVEMARGSGVVVVGNGDVMSREEGERRARETGCDGIMIGRGVFGDPWVFTENLPVRESSLLRTLVADAIRRYGLFRPSPTFHTLPEKGSTGISNNSLIFNARSPIPFSRLRALMMLIILFDEVWGETRNYDILKRHYSSYVRDFVGAKELRISLMETRDIKQAMALLYSRGVRV